MFGFLPVYGETTADIMFATLVYLAWPATLLYPLIYGLTAPWWRSWIGRALMTKAIGVFVLISFSVLYQMFGPNYWGRDYVRNIGMAVALMGFWLALFALIQVKFEARRDARTKIEADLREAERQARRLA